VPDEYDVAPVSVREPAVLELLTALTIELADGGYTADQTFGYSPDELETKGVHLVGARQGERLVGVGGIELQDSAVGELKRFYVEPAMRGSGVADAVMAGLLEHAASHGIGLIRLETGDKQLAAQGFYRRHGFVVVDRFPPYEASETSVCMQRAMPNRSVSPGV
jgi:putative acetyltransferase